MKKAISSSSQITDSPNVVDFGQKKQERSIQPTEPRILDLLTSTQIDDTTLELVVNDFGTIRVLHISKQHTLASWTLVARTMEEMVEDVLGSDN